ncbi:MAG: molybdopterin oxidoreductase [Candidatus Muproteobacteria bacterium RIFCSPHIGHO2_12_FULL_60_33]|uniref:Molybdopterin oxidoreductase n=1 Tax=Candidatus Muproteobacteria bacterium RIFCSPLOWO2_01_FULL_60_18 TaxID=1817768 RepID=A0A1F6TY58_9PROT|nr:MAG: molybdopterin oxidoreductase [Candidatus Muproteobacteria bacterium RIFCSPHIGHO2_01_60_12]OGI50063.1 MAG: molybdopterin oxidoreductase [Candidatus Muproteobacteria bacterium RIFCSPLOWO2_01_FULL_60_18]OGI55114.1 MAG: molybdopterin oxidoreductase [Candidatus Muproteobacteria bacterium RIFCSPHIGHO2_12_FULL_60_33]OGI56111.1 MAG: molybdopterin oxidoreductase [Candidatus Muproteobacteria bacterium RIFCSPHIGHO2_02_FULL_60_13]
MAQAHFDTIEGRSLGFYALLGILGAFLLAAGLAALYMEHNGHWVTGMSNQIVWGTPHVFAVFLIVAASGALNVASIASVFGRQLYKPLARLSGLLAIALLTGGLIVLVLDLGRPDRLIEAMTYYNFKSIFAWNIFLYIGFFAVVAVYLWMMMERRMNDYTRPAGIFAFLWRLTLTTGTGSIFGFLVARDAYDTAVLAPMFIIMSFSYGLAIFMVVLLAAMRWSGRELGDVVFGRLRNLLGVFVAAVLYFVTVYHLTNLYITQRHGIEGFILLHGGQFTQMFWIGQIILGSVIPLVILFSRLGQSRAMVMLASLLVILGGVAQMYVTIIGGQAYPMPLVPGKEASSSFFDGVVASYAPSLPEAILGIGGIALALAMVVVALKILPFLPNSLADADADPHYKAT